MTSSDTAPFVLPGPSPARETLTGWQHWRLTRQLFTPAPVLDLAEWRLLSPRKKTLHDLHRAATHANLPLLATPMSRSVEPLLNGRIESNALKLKARLARADGTVEELTDFRAQALARLAAQHEEIVHLRQTAAAASRVTRLPTARSTSIGSSS